MEPVTFDYFTGNCEELCQNLNAFLDKYGGQKIFNELNENDLRSRIWMQLFDVMTKDEFDASHAVCLSTLRVLSRDKTDVDKLITSERIDRLLRFAKLTKDLDEGEVFVEDKNIVEALKLICNLIFNSPEARTNVLRTNSLAITMQRIRKHRKVLSHEGRLFHLRIIFLLTALCNSTRSAVKNDLNGDIDLIEIVSEIWQRYRDNTQRFESNDVAINSEIFKILFNVNLHSTDESDEEEYNKLVTILREILLRDFTSDHAELKSDIVNLLTVVPASSYAAIVPYAKESHHKFTYHDLDMRAISWLLDFLDKRLDSNTDLVANISPVLSVLVKLCKSQRMIRKYVRLQILPPLKDVMKRPEEGTTLRAKLCKLLTSPQTNVSDLVADMIFVLCKENVGRMVKYTGYGNAAGMFANRGLLGHRPTHGTYSSESEDSDTEEYLRYKEQINPVTGCYERPKPNPLEGMSEERKEYEALQLVQLMDQLTREGIVQPCRIGEDGRPKPIEHVLELQSDSK